MEAAYNIYTNECFSGTGESGVVDERIGGGGGGSAAQRQ